MFFLRCFGDCLGIRWRESKEKQQDPSLTQQQIIVENQQCDDNSENKSISSSIQQQKTKIPNYTHYQLFQNQILYFDEKEDDDDKVFIGKLYQIKYDQDGNPKYQIKELNSINQSNYFQIKEKKVCCIGEFIEYCGKSNIQIKEKQQKCLKSSMSQPIQIKKIIIKDSNTGEILNNQSSQQQSQVYVQSYCKYNQLITQNDIQILKNQSWMTSSIIDAFVCYLNKLEQEYYFNENLNTKQLKRTYFFCSTLFTSFANAPKGFNKNHIDIFKKEILEFQELNYQIYKIHPVLVFVINQFNSHWFVLSFTFQNQQECTMQIFDSLNNQFIKKSYGKFFKQLFYETFKITVTMSDQKKIKQQNDGYSCGWHTCYYLQCIFNEEFNLSKPSYNEQQISEKLETIIKKK